MTYRCDVKHINFTFITFSVHVAVSKNGLPRSNGIKPVYTANSLLSFTLLDLFTRLAWRVTQE